MLWLTLALGIGLVSSPALADEAALWGEACTLIVLRNELCADWTDEVRAIETLTARAQLGKIDPSAEPWKEVDQRWRALRAAVAESTRDQHQNGEL